MRFHDYSIYYSLVAVWHKHSLSLSI